MSVDVTVDILFTIFKCTNFQEFQNDRLCEVVQRISVTHQEVSISFSSRHLCRSMLQVTSCSQFSSALTSRNFEKTDSARLCVRFKCTFFKDFEMTECARLFRELEFHSIFCHKRCQ